MPFDNNLWRHYIIGNPHDTKDAIGADSNNFRR